MMGVISDGLPFDRAEDEERIGTVISSGVTLSEYKN